jgi:hypothetical protein
MRWCIYYEDGSTYSDTDGPPHESPPWGAVVLWQADVHPPVMVNADYLMFRTDLDHWTECGPDGLLDHITHYAHVISCVRPTRWIPTKNFNELWERARKQRDEYALA